MDAPTITGTLVMCKDVAAAMGPFVAPALGLWAGPTLVKAGYRLMRDGWGWGEPGRVVWVKGGGNGTGSNASRGSRGGSYRTGVKGSYPVNEDGEVVARRPSHRPYYNGSIYR